ncbi:MAG: hypothetical protein V1790_17130 [Planctomycetota bacterium]
MTAYEIRTLMRARSFQGVRIYISDGESYEVTHPDMVFVTSTIVQIALPPVDDHGIPTGGSVYVDPVHVTRIQPLNGDKRATIRRRRKS